MFFNRIEGSDEMGFRNILYRHGIRRILFFAAIVFLCIQAVAAGAEPRNAITSAKALKAMSRVYMAAGRYEQARQYAELAVSAAVKDSETEAMTSACLIDLAWTDLQLGNYQAAQVNGQRALELQQTAYGQNHIYTAYTLRILASVSRQSGDYRKARQSLDESIQIMYANDAGENEIAPFIADLGELLAAQGKYDEAEQVYAAAMEKVLSSFGPTHLYTASLMTKVAALCVRQGRYDEAERLTEQSYPVLKEVFGEENYTLVDTWMNIAAIYENKGELDKAENTIRRALTTVEQKYSPEHPQAARILGTLGTFYLDHGKYEEAAVICPLALRRIEAAFGDEHDATAMARNDMARLYIREGRSIEASRMCSSAVVTLTHIFEPDHPYLAKVRRTVSSLLLAKAPEEAASLN